MATQENETAIDPQDFSMYLENPKSSYESIGKKHCIYKVFEEGCQTKPASYSPRIVSIGPFHHGDEKLKSIEQVKLYYRGLTMEDCMSKLKELEPSILSCYTEDRSFESEEFLTMILIDVGFIIELFAPPKRTKRDNWFLKPLVAKDVFHDLNLLENQLPFFVLKKLFNLAPDHYRGSSFFLEHTFDYFEDLNTQNLLPNDLGVIVEHLTHLLWILYLPSDQSFLRSRIEVSYVVGHLYSANELVKAGLKLKVDKTKKCFLELGYDNGVLTMPRIDISNEIESCMRNIVAFEQQHYPLKTYITDYLKVLDFLVSNKEDVEELLGIITSSRDSSEVVTMIKNLYSNLIQPTVNEEYLDILLRLKEFLEKPVNKLKASMKTISIAAVTILTVVQNICSVISLFKS